MFTFFKCCREEEKGSVKQHITISVTNYSQGKKLDTKVYSSTQFDSGLSETKEIIGVENPSSEEEMYLLTDVKKTFKKVAQDVESFLDHNEQELREDHSGAKIRNLL